MIDRSFVIPGTTRPLITVNRSAFGGVDVMVDGQPARRRHLRALSYDIPLEDGTVAELSLTGQWTGLKANVAGIEVPLEPPLPPFALVLMFLPFVALVGGILGALIGVTGAAINARLARLPYGWPVRVAAMLAVSTLAVGIALSPRLAIDRGSSVPVLAVGSCLNGVRENVVLTEDWYRAVDCGEPHENEVVGSVTYTGDGAYPGGEALHQFGLPPCTKAFSDYVGIPYAESSLDMILIYPSDFTWDQGDRQIFCIFYTPPGTTVSASIRGVAR